MSLHTKILDLLFPRRCPFCRRVMKQEWVLLCPECQRLLPWTEGAQGEKTVEFTDRCAAPLWYKDTVRTAHHRFKFSGLRGYAVPFGQLMSQCVKDRPEAVDVICWAPLSAKRRRKRGYDQTELLTRETAKHLGIPVEPLLEKSRHTRPQSGLTGRGERRANVLGAYRLRLDADVSGLRVLLVDDVVTTGATMSECARVLRTAGASAVYGLALALTPEKNS